MARAGRQADSGKEALFVKKPLSRTPSGEIDAMRRDSRFHAWHRYGMAFEDTIQAMDCVERYCKAFASMISICNLSIAFSWLKPSSSKPSIIHPTRRRTTIAPCRSQPAR